MSRSTFLLALIVLALVASPAAAQQPRALASGDWVRVRYNGGTQYEGRVVEAADTALVVRKRSNEAPLLIRSGDVEQVQVARGRDVVRGMARGTAWGAGIGLVVGYASGSSDCSQTFICFTREETAAALALVGGGVGLVIGGVAAPRRWLPGTIESASVAPAALPNGRMGLVLSATF